MSADKQATDYEKFRKWCEERGITACAEAKWTTLRDSLFSYKHTFSK